MARVLFGPSLVKSGAAEMVAPGIERVGWRLQVAGDEFACHLDVFRAVAISPQIPISLRDYLVMVAELRWGVRYYPREVVKSGGADFLPLENAVASLYRDHEVHRPLPVFLAELGSVLPFTDFSDRKLPNAASFVVSAAREAGFEVGRFFQYGTGLNVSFHWVLPQEQGIATRQQSLPAASIDFRPGPGRTLGKGKWLMPLDTTLYSHLGKWLRSLHRGAPEKWLSEEGREAALNDFKWTKATLLSRKDLEEARLEFIRVHPELHGRPTDLARALRADGLWSDVTELSAISKQLPKLIAAAGE